MSRPGGAIPDDDVVDVLLRQHQEIRRLFGQVESNQGEVRRDAFDALRRLLAVHETAEEEVVHPAARRAGAGAESVVEARLREENQAKQALAELEDVDPDSGEFLTRLRKLRTAVLDHAGHEEAEEFPALRASLSEEQRARMATAVRAAAAMAPTRPHPGVESATENLLVGPFAAMIDRTRDAVRRAMSG